MGNIFKVGPSVVLCMLLVLLDSRLFAQVESITLGTQVWMKRNLNTPKFRNGDLVTLSEKEDAWLKAERMQLPAGCVYENDPANAKQYGALYNWYAVNDPRGICPVGWRVPSAKDWSLLNDYIISNLGKKVRIQKDFFGLPAGIRNLKGDFESAKYHGYWWSKTELNTDGAISVFFYDYEWGQTDGGDRLFQLDTHKNMGFSVRCIKE